MEGIVVIQECCLDLDQLVIEDSMLALFRDLSSYNGQHVSGYCGCDKGTTQLRMTGTEFN